MPRVLVTLAEFNEFVAWMESESFVKVLRKTTGIEGLETDTTRHGAGIHVMDRGGFLDIHVDYDMHS